MEVADNFKIVFLLTFGFAFASVFGYFFQKYKLSPIIGYLIAGYLIGPYSPGFVADVEIAEQLAEIGVILMMFGVGLHFKWEDLNVVKNVAIPGAIGQTLITAIATLALLTFLGWPIESGLVTGLAIGVASTVVLIRILSEHHLVNTLKGHIAVGWTIVEDLITVLILLLLPTIAEVFRGNQQFSISTLGSAAAIITVKFLLLSGVVLTIGRWAINKLLTAIAQTRSEELFIISIIATVFGIATASTTIFGVSIALGAFLGGMVIGQTVINHQALANTLPLKNSFTVLFFLSIGLLFNPTAIINNPLIFISILAIIVILKPIAAIAIMKMLGYPLLTTVSIGVSLAQIGEFSFILAEEASRFHILPDDGYDILVGCAMVSIAINPSIFAFVEKKYRQILSHCSLDKNKKFLITSEELSSRIKSIVVGYGPVGKAAYETLCNLGYDVTVVETNIDTVYQIAGEGKIAIYGDAAKRAILDAACIEAAKVIVITVPDIETTIEIINNAKSCNPKIEITARVEYLKSKLRLETSDVQTVCSEDEETLGMCAALMRKYS